MLLIHIQETNLLIVILRIVIIFEIDILSHGGVSDLSPVKQEISKSSVVLVLVASMVIVVVVGMTARIPVRAYPSDSIFAQ
jgi:hypothetical protein